ncbi:MAG: hypothetical protein QNJ97_13680 [Myxococcota bacterium]|nr:hypothetical protein [Myxococcota bacterium]
MSILFAGLWAMACDSSLLVPQGIPGDGGPDEFEVLDASDNRVLPSSCTTAADCFDGDPCTLDRCNSGLCEFDLVAVGLTPIAIPTAAPARDVALAPGIAYVATGDEGVALIDLSQPTAPINTRVIATHASALGIDADERSFVVAEGAAGMETFSVPDMTAQSRVRPGVDQTVNIDVGPRYSLVSGFTDGVTVMDLANLNEPTRVAVLDTPGRVVDVAGSDVAFGFFADSLGGARCVAYDTPEGPQLGKPIPSKGRVVSVDVSGDTGIVAEYGAGFGVVDLSNPLAPTRLARMPSASPITHAALLGPQTAVIAEASGRVAVYDLRDPFRPATAATWQAAGIPLGIDTHGGLVALALGGHGVTLLMTGCVP